MKKIICSLILLSLLLPYPLMAITVHGLTLAEVTLRGDAEASGTPNLMPVGDSITRGSQDTPVLFGYRDHLQDSLGIGSYAFVGAFTDPDNDSTYDVNHGGVGGESSPNILTRIDSELDSLMPAPNPSGSKVLLMVGTNDVRSGGDGVSEAAALNNIADNPLTTASIVGKIHAHDSTVSVYVGTIIPSTDGANTTAFDSFNAALITRILAVRASKTNLHIVDVDTAFRTCNGGTYTACLADTLHPNDTGYQSISDAWYSCILSSTNANCNGN